MITFRPLNLETDVARFAELRGILSPKPITVQQILEWEEHFPRDAIHRRVVAVDARGAIVGYNNIGHMPFMLPNSF
ncbi:MAG: hypothetical protein L0Y55_16615, partial [Anaerolineales bacterium]|nr:hypothetical protein [Anaerolineales bacterium]